MKFRGDALKAARDAKGLSQQELATQVGVAISTIQRAEYGTNVPAADLVARIALVLEVDLGEFFTTNGEAA